jgi:hypothetical protein
MTVLWPRLPAPIATKELDRIKISGPGQPEVQHPAQIYTPVGGRRATDSEIRKLITVLTNLATAHGYPQPASDQGRITFDRRATTILHDIIDLSWSEAGQRDTWSFLAIVTLPHLTSWRFGTNNPERWIATDLTRHTWSRLWWQAVVFENDPAVLDALTESDLNQLLERRTMGGDARLICALARSIVDRTPDGAHRRPLVRDVTARLLRRLAFIDAQALNDTALAELCKSETDASWQRLRHASQQPAARPFLGGERSLRTSVDPV